MWNDIRAGVLAAKGQRFLLFAYNACNACFGPWNTHADFDSMAASFSAWLSSSCASSQCFLENLRELAHDRGILVPVGEANVKDFFESLKEHVFVCDRGATSNDVLVQLEFQHQVLVAKFTLIKQGLLSYLRHYYEEDAGPLEEPAATIDGAAAKSQYAEELRRLQKGCNRSASAAKLPTPWLRHEMMLYMKVTDAHWLAFGPAASLKLNGKNDRRYCHNMTIKQWYFILRESLIIVIQTTSTLKTSGVALGGQCGEENAPQEQRGRCARLLDVALAINGFRADSLREHDSSYPMRFALGATTRSRSKFQRRFPSSLADGRSRLRR